MAFESLADKLNQAFKKLRGKGKLNEADIKEAMREVKLALLEADVNFKVVKAFIAAVTEKAVGEQVLESLTPAQQVIKIVNDELCEIMGRTQSKIKMASQPPTVVMMCGLQGSGKTTHCGKLAAYFKKQNRRPLMVACDIYRPAAIKQLQVVGEKVDVPVFTMPEGTKPLTIAQEAVKHALRHGNDIVFLDTAGRLHIDEVLMGELTEIKEKVKPSEILLVIDSMIGQDAVNVASSFDEALGIDGIVLTKLDGDTRGGAALSVRYVTGKPIKFVGVGEKMDDLEPFHPDRMAQRILGMGDIVTLAEKAQQTFDDKKAAELEKKIRTQSFDLNDFVDQVGQMRNMGGMEKILSMMPGGAGALKGVQVDEKQFDRMEAMVLSMTEKERRKPEIITYSRRQRIARGSGVRVEEVGQMLRKFEQSKKLMKQLGNMKGKRGMGGMKFPF